MSVGYIYALSDPQSPKLPRYIGRTKWNPHFRMFEHFVWSYRHLHHPFSKWLLDLYHRKQWPKVLIYEVAPLELLKPRETFWIRFFRPLGTLLNVNDGDGAGPNARVSEASRQATIARNKKGWTPQMRAKIIASKVGKKWTPEQRATFLSLPCRGKIMEAFRKHSMQCKKPVMCIETGEQFDSLAALAKEYKKNPRGIGKCLAPNRTFMGKHWKFINQN